MIIITATSCGDAEREDKNLEKNKKTTGKKQ